MAPSLSDVSLSKAKKQQNGPLDNAHKHMGAHNILTFQKRLCTIHARTCN